MDSSYSAQEECSQGHLFSPRSITNPVRQQQNPERHSAYKDLISHIAESLTSLDVRNILWHYDLPDKMKEDSALDVLVYLHRRQNSLFNECNVGPLEELLNKINQLDLVASKVKPYEEEFGATMTRPVSYSMPLGAVNPRVSVEKRPVSYHGQPSNSNQSTNNVSKLPVNYESTPYQETMQNREPLASIPDTGLPREQVLQSSGHSQSSRPDMHGSGVHQEQTNSFDQQSSYSEATLQHSSQPVQYVPQHNHARTAPQQQLVTDVYHPQLQSYPQSPRANDRRQGRGHPCTHSEELSLPINLSMQTLPLGMHRGHTSSQSLPQRANNYYNDPRHVHSMSQSELQPMSQSRVPLTNQSYYYPQHTVITPAHNTSTPLVNRPQSAAGPPSFGHRHEPRQLRSLSGPIHEAPTYVTNRNWYNTSQDSILEDNHLSHSSGFASSGDMMLVHDHYPYHMNRRQSLPPKPTYIFRGDPINTYQHTVFSQDHLLTSPQYEIHSNSMSSAEGHSHSGGPLDYYRRGQVQHCYDQSPPAVSTPRFCRSLTAGPVLSYRREGSTARVQIGDVYPEDVPHPASGNDFRREQMTVFDRSDSRSPYSSTFQHYCDVDYHQDPGQVTELRIDEQDEQMFGKPPVQNKLSSVDNSHDDKHQSSGGVLNSRQGSLEDVPSKPAPYDKEHLKHAKLSTDVNKNVSPETNPEVEEGDLSECEDYPQPVLRRSSCSKPFDKRRWSSLEPRDKKNIFKTFNRLSLHSVDKSSEGSLLDAQSSPHHKQTTSSKSSLNDVCEKCELSTRAGNKPLKKTPFTRNWFSMFRSKLVLPGQELTWQEKVEDINKLIYKPKHRGKYLTCPWKIEVEGKGQPNPKILLHLHPYGLEEDENQNATFEVAIEQPKRHRLHSSAKLSLQLSAEDDKHGRQLGKTYKGTKDLKLRFFYVKGFISHEELKQSHSDNVVIRVKVEMFMPGMEKQSSV